MTLIIQSMVRKVAEGQAEGIVVSVDRQIVLIKFYEVTRKILHCTRACYVGKPDSDSNAATAKES